MNLFVSLRYLVALDDHGHFGRAALSCHVTQPALSNGLRALEEHYGVAIIKRGRSFAGFTPEGELVLAFARRTLREQELLTQDLSSTADSPTGNILIGAVPTAVPLAARFAARLRQVHQGIHPTVRSMSSVEIETGLEQLALDMGLGYTERIKPGASRLQVLHQYDESYYLLRQAGGSRGKHLVIGEPLRWANAAALPLCLLSAEMHNRTLVDRAFAEAGHSVVAVMETNSITTLIVAVIAGEVCSILPGSLVALSKGFEGLEACPLVDPEIKAPISLIVSKAEHIGRTQLAALALAQDPDWLKDVQSLAGTLRKGS